MSVSYGGSMAEYMVKFVYKNAQLFEYTRYGHREPEYYVTVAGTRISLYFDSPEVAWTDAAFRIQQRLHTPEPASLLEI